MQGNSFTVLKKSVNIHHCFSTDAQSTRCKAFHYYFILLLVVLLIVITDNSNTAGFIQPFFSFYYLLHLTFTAHSFTVSPPQQTHRGMEQAVSLPIKFKGALHSNWHGEEHLLQKSSEETRNESRLLNYKPMRPVWHILQIQMDA